MKTKPIVWGLAIVLVALALVLVFGLWQQPTSPTATQPTAVTIGYLPIAAGLPLYVAQDRGYFKEAGFDVTLSRFTSSNELGNAGAAGRVDAMMPYALNVAFDIATVTGKKAKLFGINVYSDQVPHIVDYFVARPNAGVKTLADLRGKTIGAFPGSVTRVFVEHILSDAGVSPEDYTYIELSPLDWQPALLSGRIDAASVMEPQYSQIVADGAATPIINGFFAKLMPDVPLSGHWLSDHFVASHTPEAIAPFVGAFDRAVDFIRESPDEAKKHYADYTAIRQELLPTLQLNRWVKSTELDARTIQEFADILASGGAMQAPIQAEDFLYSQAD